MPTTDLMNLVSWAAPLRFYPDFGHETSGQGSGQINRASLRPTQWRASLKSIPMTRAAQAGAEALIEDIRDSLETIYAWHPTKQYPVADPDGSVLGASSVTIHTLDDDNRRMRLQGLPVGYVLTRGDLLSFDFSSTHRALHRVVTATVTADGSGITPLFSVTPFIQPGAATSAAVTLVKPSMEAIILSHEAPKDTILGTISVDLIQVL